MYAFLLHSFGAGQGEAQYARQGHWLTMSNHGLSQDIYSTLKTRHLN